MGQEAFKIGATLQLKGNAAADLEKLRLVVLKADEAFTALTERMKLLNGQFLNLGTIVRRLNPSLNVFTSQLGLATTEFKGANASITGFNTRLSNSVTRVDRLTVSTAALKNELSGLSIATDSAAAGLIGVGGAGGRRRKRHGFRAHARSYEAAGVGFGLGGPVGIAAAVGGYGVYKSYGEAKTYMQAQAEFAQLNLGDEANKTADAYAKNLKLVGVSQIEALKTLRDSVVVMGDLGHAMQIAPIISKMQYSNNALFSGAGIKIGESQYQDLLRVVEMRGGFKSPQEMIKQINEMQKVMSGTGGRVLPNQYLNLMKTGGVAAQHMSDEALYYGTEPLIQEMGGFRVGTGMMSMYQAIQAGKMTTQAAIRWQQLGLIRPGMAQYNKIGMIKRVKPGGVVGTDLEGNNFEKWIYDVYLPALRAHGITSEGDTLKEIAYDFGNRTAANLVSKAYLQKTKIEKNMAISQRAKGSEQSYASAQLTPAGKEIALKQSLSDLGVAFGKLTMPAVIGGITGLTKLVTELTKFINFLNTINFFVHPAANTVATGGNQTIQNHTTLFLHKNGVDKLADAVTTNIVKSANAVPNNTARFDTGMTPTPVVTKFGLY